MTGSGFCGRLRRSPLRAGLALLVLGLLGTGLAFAATLAFGSKTLGAGGTTVVTCTAGLRATYAVAWDTSTKAYKLTTLTLKGDTSACPVGGTLSVDVIGSSNSSLYHFSHALVSDDIGASASIALAPSSTVAAAPIRGVAAGVTG